MFTVQMFAAQRSSVRIVVAAFLLSFLYTPRCFAEQAEFSVGFAKQIITPDQPMWMSGYGSRSRPADGKLTDLWAKVMVIEDSANNVFALVTLDLVGIDRKTTTSITDAAAQRFNLPRHSIAISTTHTHSGPVVGENLKAMYELDGAAWEQIRTYTDNLVECVVELIGQARENAQPAKLEWTVGRARFGVNRRSNPEAEVLTLRAADRLRGPVDHDVPILVVRNLDTDRDSAVSQIRGIICGYACHATVLSGYQWCGDWPGYAQENLEQRYPGAIAMVWAGCGADINPLPRRDVQLARQYGAEIDTAVATALQRPTQAITGRLATVFEEIPLPLASLPTKEQLQATLGSDNRYEVGRARLLLEQWEQHQGLSKTYPYPIQTLRLGDGPTWVFLGGEVVVDYALRLKFELGAGKTWVTGYCNDVMAYIGSKRVINEGGYEGGGAMLYYGLPSPWSEAIEEQIFDTVHSQVSGLTKNDRPTPAVRPIAYPSHRDLSHYKDDAGQLQPIENSEHWQFRKAHVLNNLQYVMGRMPELDHNLPLELQVKQTEQFEGYRRQTVTYRAIRGQTVTAHLYLPGSDQQNLQKSPAVLALHPTSDLGKRVVAGEGPLANRAYAVELAQQGFVVLAPDYPSFGELADYDFHTDQYLSGSMTAIVNHRRGIDLLQSLDQVDAERIGVIGHSLGGHNAIFLAAMDPRVKAVVTSCGWDPFHNYYDGKLSGWSSDRYMPRIRELFATDPDLMPFDFPELIAAIAPRAFFSSSPLHDSNFSADGVKAVQPAIGRIYDLFDAKGRFQIVYPDCEHDFPQAARQQAYDFLDRHLKQ